MRSQIDARQLPAFPRSVAEDALRRCVHCGFCNATCPTYQVTGNELDGPRGRIYLMKQALEGEPVTRLTQQHLDRCLTCTACETTCPSGVSYHDLLAVGRSYVDHQVKRPWRTRLMRQMLRLVASRRRLFALATGVARLAGPLLPATLRRQLPARRTSDGATPAVVSTPDATGESFALLEGCVQSVMSPDTNAAAARVLSRLGAREVVRLKQPGCCGAIHFHFGDEATAKRMVERNVRILARALDQGNDAIVVTASGCGAFMRDYASVLADPQTGEVPAAAERVVAALRDISEVIDLQALRQRTADTAPPPADAVKLQLHCPCTLEHGLRASHRVRTVLEAAGLAVADDPAPGACCGSAGAYSVLQPDLADTLGGQRARLLERSGAQMILTANTGCQHHLDTHSRLPVQHWIAALDRRLDATVDRP